MPQSPLTLQPMIHVEQMAPAIGFYEALGGRLVRGSRDGDWALIELGGGQISLLAHPPNPDQDEGRIELNFQADGSLDEIAAALRSAGVAVEGPSDAEAFGRQLLAHSPDGLLIKINELRDDL